MRLDSQGMWYNNRGQVKRLSQSVLPGLSLELRVHVPDLEWPLMIDEARVQWVSGQVVGLAFFQIRETEHQRLEQVLRNLMEG
ncbi:MAG: hypothetical protein ABIQ79_09645 [Nitrospiraceae bacterium]